MLDERERERGERSVGFHYSRDFYRDFSSARGETLFAERGG